MAVLKKVFAVCSENDFYKFRARAQREGHTMGEALSALVHQYANTGETKINGTRTKRFNYLEASSGNPKS